MSNDTDRTPPLPDADAATRLAALRRGVAAGLRRVNPLVDPDAAAMLDGLLDALAVGDLSRLASELGLIGRGGTSRDVATAYDDRDFLIRALHRQMGIADRGEAGAAQVVQRFKRYESVNWKRDRTRSDPPADPVAALCWNLLRLALPDSRRMPSPESVAAILKKVQSMF
jgi:hypothetical protein